MHISLSAIFTIIIAAYPVFSIDSVSKAQINNSVEQAKNGDSVEIKRIHHEGDRLVHDCSHRPPLSAEDRLFDRQIATMRTQLHTCANKRLVTKNFDKMPSELAHNLKRYLEWENKIFKDMDGKVSKKICEAHVLSDRNVEGGRDERRSFRKLRMQQSSIDGAFRRNRYSQRRVRMSPKWRPTYKNNIRSGYESHYQADSRHVRGGNMRSSRGGAVRVSKGDANYFSESGHVSYKSQNMGRTGRVGGFHQGGSQHASYGGRTSASYARGGGIHQTAMGSTSSKAIYGGSMSSRSTRGASASIKGGSVQTSGAIVAGGTRGHAVGAAGGRSSGGIVAVSGSTKSSGIKHVSSSSVHGAGVSAHSVSVGGSGTSAKGVRGQGASKSVSGGRSMSVSGGASSSKAAGTLRSGGGKAY